MNLVVLLAVVIAVDLVQCMTISLTSKPTPTPTPILMSTSTSTSTSCSTASECGEGYCCVGNMFGRRKRMFLGSLFGTDHKKCEPERQENDPCHVFTFYAGYCPCIAGLECRGETVDESGSQIVHHNPKCQPKSSGTGH